MIVMIINCLRVVKGSEGTLVTQLENLFFAIISLEEAF